ncbi:MAG: endonuclease/exonuclease/phosphatase family protein [Sideroxydans sp.]|nr:endonuclease/exonuclease/phosphatase family protein [Sideroxydans sp.]
MGTFKVLQFNMQFGQVWDDADPDKAPIDLDQTIAEILRQDADIVLLQEVEKAQPGGKQINPAPNYTKLSRALNGYHGYFSYPKEDSRELPFGIGLAIFSKTPLYDPFRLELPSPPVEFEFNGEAKTPTDRLLIGAKTTIDGHEVQLYNTHLLAFFMLNSSGSIHSEQRQLVLNQVTKSRIPTLLGGDFNASNHLDLIDKFAQEGFRAVQSKEITWRRMPYVLDHIFYDPQLQLVSQAVIPTLSSDHHLLVAELDFVE